MSQQIPTLIESVQPVKLYAPNLISTGGGVSFGAHVNIANFDSAIIRLQVGAFAGTVTLSAKLYEQQTMDGDASLIPITGADFGVITGTTTEQVFTAGIEVKNYKQYLALRLQASPTAATLSVCADLIGGKPDNAPVGNNPTFWVTGQ
jgi:hypothetical protein